MSSVVATRLEIEFKFLFSVEHPKICLDIY